MNEDQGKEKKDVRTNEKVCLYETDLLNIQNINLIDMRGAFM